MKRCVKVPVDVLRDMPPRGLRHLAESKTFHCSENCSSAPSWGEEKGSGGEEKSAPLALCLADCPSQLVGYL